MKKRVLMFLSILILSSAVSVAYAKNTTNSELAEIIKMYKDGNYSECYLKLENYIQKDPTSALAYYYMGMTSAQIGKKEDAISNYEKALTLSNSKNLTRYAKKGKRCLEEPDKCGEDYESVADRFIQNVRGPKTTDEVKSDYERLKIENFMREMNRNDSIDPQEFKNYKDFSSVPTNDEIVAAIRTLQNAGLGNIVNNNYADLSILTGNSQQNSMLNMMGGASLNPQLIQALLTNNMTQGF